MTQRQIARTCLGGLVAAAAVTATPSLVHAQESPTVIQVCVDRTKGVFRLLNAPADVCDSRKEFPLSWNAAGPAGPAGPTGPQGPTGPTGSTPVAMLPIPAVTLQIPPLCSGEGPEGLVTETATGEPTEVGPGLYRPVLQGFVALAGNFTRVTLGIARMGDDTTLTGYTRSAQAGSQIEAGFGYLRLTDRTSVVVTNTVAGLCNSNGQVLGRIVLERIGEP